MTDNIPYRIQSVFSAVKGIARLEFPDFRLKRLNISTRNIRRIGYNQIKARNRR
jgi:hypothetical protein